MITTVILGAALSLGVVITSSLQRATLSAHSLKSYYVAESGIEKSLYEIRKDRAVISAGNCGLISPPADLSCNRRVSYQTEAIFPLIKKDQSIQLNLFDPAGGKSAGINSLKIICSEADTQNNFFPWVELILIPVIDWQIQPELAERYLRSCRGQNVQIITNLLTPVESYVFRLKALYDDVKDVTVKSYASADASGSPLNLAAKFLISSQGDFKFSRQIISTQTAAQPTTIGYFDYVLFSEQSLDKVQPAPPPPPPPPPNNNNGG